MAGPHGNPLCCPGSCRQRWLVLNAFEPRVSQHALPEGLGSHRPRDSLLLSGLPQVPHSKSHPSKGWLKPGCLSPMETGCSNSRLLFFPVPLKKLNQESSHWIIKFILAHLEIWENFCVPKRKRKFCLICNKNAPSSPIFHSTMRCGSADTMFA